MGTAYNCDFAAKLVLDLARFDRFRGVLLNELRKVFDAHCGGLPLSKAEYTSELKIRNKREWEKRTGATAG